MQSINDKTVSLYMQGDDVGGIQKKEAFWYDWLLKEFDNKSFLGKITGIGFNVFVIYAVVSFAYSFVLNTWYILNPPQKDISLYILYEFMCFIIVLVFWCGIWMFNKIEKEEIKNKKNI